MFCRKHDSFLGVVAQVQKPGVVWRGRSPFNYNPQGWLRRPEDSDFCAGSAAKRRRPEQIIATLQFLRPEISVEISAKTVILLPIRQQIFVLTKQTIRSTQPTAQNESLIHFERLVISTEQSIFSKR